ncbi:hypothetical protein EYF80_007373 [Liparis tanakae]|uniref:Uncharacterized protein n=1 Tax=Liparis tanakae TaxID=230148 RepID=A0A4Z2IYD1_9TELE|nr:hypothetical protein EYF80_007373 [Liparis tanakae]
MCALGRVPVSLKPKNRAQCDPRTGRAGRPILTGWANSPPSSSRSPHPSSLLRVAPSGGSRPRPFTSAVPHMPWAGLCSLWAGLCSLWAGLCTLWAGLCTMWAGLCLFSSGSALGSLLWTLLDAAGLPPPRRLLLAEEGGRISTGVKKRRSRARWELRARRRGCRFRRLATARGGGLARRLLHRVQSQVEGQPVPAPVGLGASLLRRVGGTLSLLRLLGRVAGHAVGTSVNVASVVRGVIWGRLALDEEVAARRRVAQSVLEELQLTQEVEVQAQAVHDVGHGHGRGAGDAGCTVDQHRGPGGHGRI